MTKRQDRDAIYVKRQFDTEIIGLCVRWYITYRLSYRDLVAMMAERGVIMSHTTIMRWVIRYVPEFEKRWNRFARSIGSSWRVDETYISIKGKWHYLYRAVDKQGRSVDFMLRPDRGIAAAQAFFRRALASHPRIRPFRAQPVDAPEPCHCACHGCNQHQGLASPHDQHEGEQLTNARRNERAHSRRTIHFGYLPGRGPDWGMQHFAIP
jgi:transposase-like protein